MAEEKELTLKFRATSKNYQYQLKKIEETIRLYNLMGIEYGNLNFDGVSITIDAVQGGLK